MKATCLIVDDEPLAVQLLKKHVESLDTLQLAATCGNAIEAASYLMQQSVDLIFLDIQMPKLTGIDFLKTLKAPPAVIITTAHREFALEGYELEIIDYLLKPISFERFLASVERYWRRKQKPENNTFLETALPADVYVSIKSGTKTYQFNEADIIYIESLKDFIQIHLKTGKPCMIKYQIGLLEKALPVNFIRVHKSYIVNKKCISVLTSNTVEIGATIIPVGESYKSIVGSLFG